MMEASAVIAGVGERRRRVARYVAIAAPLVAVIAAFLPWGTTWGFISSDHLTVNATTRTAGALVPGAWLVVAPLVAIILQLAATPQRGRRAYLTLSGLAVVALIVNLWIAVVNLSRMTDEDSVGPGLPLVIAVSTVAIVAIGRMVAARPPAPA